METLQNDVENELLVVQQKEVQDLGAAAKGNFVDENRKEAIREELHHCEMALLHVLQKEAEARLLQSDSQRAEEIVQLREFPLINFSPVEILENVDEDPKGHFQVAFLMSEFMSKGQNSILVEKGIQAIQYSGGNEVHSLHIAYFWVMSGVGQEQRLQVSLQTLTLHIFEGSSSHVLRQDRVFLTHLLCLREKIGEVVCGEIFPSLETGLAEKLPKSGSQRGVNA